MTREFDVTDTATWGVILTIHDMCAIYSRTVGAIRKACQQGRFVPAPLEGKPYRWRRCDVLRHVEGSRVVGLQQRRAS